MSLSALHSALEGPLPPLVTLVGDETLLVEQAEALVVERGLQGVMKAFNHGVWRAGDDASVEALGVCRTLPMMNPRRVVVLRDIQEASSKVFEALDDYCGKAASTTLLVVTGSGWGPRGKGKPDWGRRIEGAVKKSGGLALRFKSADSDPAAFAMATAKDLGCRLSSTNARLLVDMVGKDLGRLSSELHKAALYMGGPGDLNGEVLREVCSLLADAVVWDLTDAVAEANADRALATCHRLLEDGGSGEPHRLIAMITWQVRRMLLVQEARRLRCSPADLGLKMSPWQLKKLDASLSRHPLDAGRVMEVLAHANHDMNSHRAGSRRVLESLVLELVSR